MSAYLIGGGHVDEAWLAQSLTLEEGDVLIAVDKGLAACISLGIKPDYIVGDFDSLPGEYVQALEQCQAEVLRLNPIKDDTDMEAALNLAFEASQGPIYILGGTGTRLDHVMGNVSILGLGFEHSRQVYLLDGYNRISLICAEQGRAGVSLAKAEQYGRFVSCFPFQWQVEGLCLEGFKYPLADATLGGYNSLGVSNEIVAEVAHIRFAEGTLLLIEARD